MAIFTNQAILSYRNGAVSSNIVTGEIVEVLTVTKGLMDMEDGSLVPYPYLWQKKLDELGKKIPLNAIIGPEGFSYFNTAYEIYTVLLMVSSVIPMPLSDTEQII